MVWLNNASEFSDFTANTFSAYQKLDQLDQDTANWKTSCARLVGLSGSEFNEELVKAWLYTELAEFALYGAERFITKQLRRFDERTLPKIWGAFTLLDKSSFLNSLDDELAESGDAKIVAEKYPWIRDGYAGPNDEAQWYFERRLEAIEKDGLPKFADNETIRREMAEKYSLTDDEIKLLALARRLAEFMDDRKAWMMQSRRLITQPVGDIKHGWFFDKGETTLIGQDETHELWQRYVDFKSSISELAGVVANTGGRHFISGEVAVLNSHTDPVDNDKILVVPSTSPGWVPLMRHARALVTDHGGMMSHAAIVAREFNLPCIVGTKSATKVLLNNDKIIIDLIKGEVRKMQPNVVAQKN
jgi:phosphohistidine swiveling domain-containing protein